MLLCPRVFLGPPGVDGRLLPFRVQGQGLHPELWRPLGLLRTLTVCTLPVNFIYLFCEKEETEIHYYLQGLKAVPKSRKTN